MDSNALYSISNEAKFIKNNTEETNQRLRKLQRTMDDILRELKKANR